MFRPDGFTGYPDSFNPSPLVTYNVTKVVTSLMCNIEGNCINRTATRNESCDDFAIVTCGIGNKKLKINIFDRSLLLVHMSFFSLFSVWRKFNSAI